MDNFKNINTYHSDWQSLSQAVEKHDSDYVADTEGVSEEFDLNNTERKAKGSKHPVLFIQLVLCLCVLLFFFLIKFLSEPLYTYVLSWYNSQLSSSVIYNGDFESFDYSAIFSTADEV